MRRASRCASPPASPDPDDPTLEIPIAAIQLHPGDALDLDGARRPPCQALPEYARPRGLRVVDELPLTDGFRPIKRGRSRMPTSAAIVSVEHAHSALRRYGIGGAPTC